MATGTTIHTVPKISGKLHLTAGHGLTVDIHVPPMTIQMFEDPFVPKLQAVGDITKAPAEDTTN